MVDFQAHDGSVSCARSTNGEADGDVGRDVGRDVDRGDADSVAQASSQIRLAKRPVWPS